MVAPRSIRLVVSVLLTMTALASTTASAGAVTIGSTAPPGAFAPSDCDAGGGVRGLWMQRSVGTPGIPSYAAPFAGRITSWSSDQYGPFESGKPLTLVVVRPDGYGYKVAAVDHQVLPDPLPTIDDPVATFQPPSPIPVAKGDVIALFSNSNSVGCYFSGTETATDVVSYSPFDSQPGVGAAVPLLGNAIYYRVDVSATLDASPKPKPKRCKKKGHKRSATAAKKCKRKK